MAGNITSGTGGTIDVAGATVQFPADAFANASGSLYNGEVRVFAQWLNPVAENLGNIMPGALYGVNTDGEEVLMTSMGMLAVELEDANGNPLQLAGGRKATLSFPIPAALQSHASNEIPLWYFDETDGIWIEEGKATLQDGVYTGQVSHFTYWNVDFPTGSPLVQINGCVSYADGTPVSYRSFRVRDAATEQIFGFGSTDAVGGFGGLLPINSVFNLEFTDACGNAVNFEIGPLTEDTVLPTCFILDQSTQHSLHGQLTDCDGNGVDGGYVHIQTNNYYTSVVQTDADGYFNASLPNCTAAEATVIGYDITNAQASQEVQVQVNGATDMGTLPACDNPLEEYIDSDANGSDQYFFIVSLGSYLDSLGGEPTEVYSLSGQLQAGSGIFSSINLIMSDIAVGSYMGENVSYSYNESNANQGGLGLFCERPCDGITIDITSNGGPGGFLVGSYSGTADGWQWNGGSNEEPLTNAPVSGTFRVRIPE
ncbi:MAG: hypothetical protein R2795_14165 [Saprospiraceae bacterium]